MFQVAENKLKKYYWLEKGRRSIWSAGKFIASVGHITLDQAKKYLENQETHHAEY